MRTSILCLLLFLVACKKPDTYTITISAQTGGTVSSIGGTYEEGGRLEITATPDETYRFVQWSDGSTSNPYVLNVEKNVTLVAHFEKIKHLLSIEKQGEGEVKETLIRSGKSTEYIVGSEVELLAQPSTHWYFSHWTGTVSTTQNPLKVKMDNPMSLKAIFVKSVYALDVHLIGQGSVLEKIVTSSNKTDYEGGTRVQLTAKPDEHWSFAGWSGAVSSTSNPIELDMTEAHTVTATFIQNQYALTVGIEGQGQVEEQVITSSGKTDYGGGTRIQLTAKPDKHWSFAGWSGAVSSTSNPVELDMTEAHTVTATFIQNQYALTVGIEGQGQVEEQVITSSGKTDYAGGTRVQLTAKPDEYWSFAGWSGAVSSTSNPVELDMTEAHTVTATFIQNQYALTVGIEGQGQVEEQVITSSGKTDYAGGTRVQLTAKPDKHWSFAGWSGAVSSTSNPVELDMTEAHTVTATFIQNQYALTVGIEGQGQVEEQVITSSGKTDYAGGTRVQLTAKPDKHWSFAGWSGAVSSTSNPVELDMTEAHTVTATFIQNQYALTVGIEGQGQVDQKLISKARSTDYLGGNVIQLEAKPDTGSLFVAWSGATKETEDRIKILMDDNKQVTATFEQQTTRLKDDSNTFRGVGKWKIRRPRSFMRLSADCILLEVTFKTNGTFVLLSSTSTVTGNYRVDNDTTITLWQEDKLYATLENFILSQSFIGFTLQIVGECSQEMEGDKDHTYVEPESDFKVNASQTEFTFNHEAGTGKVLFNTSNIIGKTNDDWLWFEQTEKELRFTVQPNTSTNERNGVIGVFYNNNFENFVLEIKITQSGKPATSKITLAENGVTIECPDAPIGHKEIVNGKEYEVVDLATLKSKITNNEAVDCVCTSQLTTLEGLFAGNSTFNQDISSWDVGQVTSLKQMFQYASSFNGSLNHWDTSNVTNMAMLFNGTTFFNQPIGNWDTSRVTTMEGLFLNAKTFNQPIAQWDVRQVENFDQMFRQAGSFDQSLNTWKTDNAVSMSYMFSEAHSFNQPLNQWNTHKVLRMDYMFLKATSFNGDISTWQVGNVGTMKGMFQDAGLFNQNIKAWDVSNTTYMDYLFYNAYNFNQDLSGWCVQKVLVEPSNFIHVSAVLQAASYPVWGTCPNGG